MNDQPTPRPGEETDRIVAPKATSEPVVEVPVEEMVKQEAEKLRRFNARPLLSPGARRRERNANSDATPPSALGRLVAPVMLAGAMLLFAFLGMALYSSAEKQGFYAETDAYLQTHDSGTAKARGSVTAQDFRLMGYGSGVLSSGAALMLIALLNGRRRAAALENESAAEDERHNKTSSAGRPANPYDTKPTLRGMVLRIVIFLVMGLSGSVGWMLYQDAPRQGQIEHLAMIIARRSVAEADEASYVTREEFRNYGKAGGGIALAGFILLIVIEFKRRRSLMRTCTACQSRLHPLATICKHCRTALPPLAS